jgi:hypothetical protein
MCLSWLMDRLDRATGFRKRYKIEGKPDFSRRLWNIREYLIAQNEDRYGIKAAVRPEHQNDDPPPDTEWNLQERIDNITGAAMDRAKKILGINWLGTNIAEWINELRQICWDRIYLPGRETLEGLSRVERSLLDLRAGEAWHAGRHIELADFLRFFRSPLPKEDAPLHLKIEYAQNLWDLANRTMGGSYSTRNINIFPRRVIIQAAAPINLTDRLPGYHQDRKAAIQSAMADLHKAYLDCIEEANEAD